MGSPAIRRIGVACDDSRRRQRTGRDDGKQGERGKAGEPRTHRRPPPVTPGAAQQAVGDGRHRRC
ncbi:hypothetical protein [Azospirillum palustre]